MTVTPLTRTIVAANSRSREGPGTATGNRRPRVRPGVGKKAGEGSTRVTENERRAADSLRASDLLLRGFSVIGLIAVTLVLLLVLNPT